MILITIITTIIIIMIIITTISKSQLTGFSYKSLWFDQEECSDLVLHNTL